MLKCKNCGIEATYADASIMDNRNEGCEVESFQKINGYNTTIEKPHNWVEK